MKKYDGITSDEFCGSPELGKKALRHCLTHKMAKQLKNDIDTVSRILFLTDEANYQWLVAGRTKDYMKAIGAESCTIL
jgi:hypothetical protein